jgi:Fe2+ or Zn2+ uptake regulation protein
MKNTIQRQEILNYLNNSREHPTAEKILNDLRKKMPNLSLGTVYRNLNILVENKKIKEIKTKEKVRYDGNPIKHQHLICENCEKIIDTNIFEELTNQIKNKKIKGFQTNQVKIISYGLCTNCK